MPFWKKEAPLPTAPPPPPAVVAPRPRTGTLPCSEQGCSRRDAVACAYVDRRRRPCPTAWCPDHQALTAGQVLCRRHSSLFAVATGDEFQPNQVLPDLDNRSPSLANFIGDVLEPGVLELLRGLCRPGSNDQVAAEPLQVIHPAGGGGRRWDRIWKLYDHTGVIVKVAVEVDEGRDPEVDVKVGRHVVACGVPPWIARRRQGLPASDPSEDAVERERFYAMLLADVAPRVISEVEQSRSPLGYPSA